MRNCLNIIVFERTRRCLRGSRVLGCLRPKGPHWLVRWFHMTDDKLDIPGRGITFGPGGFYVSIFSSELWKPTHTLFHHIFCLQSTFPSEIKVLWFPRRVKAPGFTRRWSLARPHPGFIGNRRLRLVRRSCGEIRGKMSSLRATKEPSSKTRQTSFCIDFVDVFASALCLLELWTCHV